MGVFSSHSLVTPATTITADVDGQGNGNGVFIIRPGPGSIISQAGRGSSAAIVHILTADEVAGATLTLTAFSHVFGVAQSLDDGLTAITTNTLTSFQFGVRGTPEGGYNLAHQTTSALLGDWSLVLTVTGAGSNAFDVSAEVWWLAQMPVVA